MAKHIFDWAIKNLSVHEGGYSNHPSDPGGPTKYGITIHDYRKYINKAGTAEDVKRLTLDQATRIYRPHYWDALRCDELPAGLDYSVFDYGVNSGVGRAGKVLRRLCGLPDTVSTVTPEVLTAVGKRDPIKLIEAMNAERLKFLQSLSTWNVFGNGWTRRVAEVRERSIAYASSAPISAPREKVVGKPVEGISSTTTKVLLGGGLTFSGAVGAVYSWASANPLLAALIVEAAVAVVIFSILWWDSTKKPEPVPEQPLKPVKKTARTASTKRAVKKKPAKKSAKKPAKKAAAKKISRRA